MIVTESFVWINYPKSGSTFVREALRKLYRRYEKKAGRAAGRRFFRFLGPRQPERWIEEVEVPEERVPRSAGRRGRPTPHGTVDQIPEQYRHLPILSSFRDPLERAVSGYRYGDWKKPDVIPVPLEEVRSWFPAFPDLSLLEFVELQCRINRLPLRVGDETFELLPFSADLLKFYSRTKVDADEGVTFSSWSEVDESIPEIRFLRQESLSRDLVDELQRLGYPEDDLAFIGELDRVNASSDSFTLGEEERTALAGRLAEDWLLEPLVKRLLERVPLEEPAGISR